MTVNHGVLGSSPCSGANARGLHRKEEGVPSEETSKETESFEKIRLSNAPTSE